MKRTLKVASLVLIYILLIVMLSNTKSSLSYVATAQVEPEIQKRAVQEFTKNGQKFYILDTFSAEVSAYSSSVQETDDTPFLTASGQHVARGTRHNRLSVTVCIWYTCFN